MDWYCDLSKSNCEIHVRRLNSSINILEEGSNGLKLDDRGNEKKDIVENQAF